MEGVWSVACPAPTDIFCRTLHLCRLIAACTCLSDPSSFRPLPRNPSSHSRNTLPAP